MPDDDDGWGGTVDEGWASQPPSMPQRPAAPDVTPAVPPVAPPVASTSLGGPESGYPTTAMPDGAYPSTAIPGAGSNLGYPTSELPPVSPAPTPSPGRRPSQPMLIGGGVVVLIAIVAVIAALASGGHHKTATKPTVSPVSKPTTPTSASITPSPTPTPTPTPTKAATTLESISPFKTGCSALAKADFSSPAVVEQMTCAGSAVQTAVGAQGVSYAKFASATSLESWYETSALKANGIKTNTADCTVGTTITTTNGAHYCEGVFDDDTGATARQMILQAPGNVDITVGPNSTVKDCAGSAYTLMIATSPSDSVAYIALSCTATSAVAQAIENSLTAGNFDLDD